MKGGMSRWRLRGGAAGRALRRWRRWRGGRGSGGGSGMGGWSRGMAASRSHDRCHCRDSPTGWTCGSSSSSTWRSSWSSTCCPEGADPESLCRHGMHLVNTNSGGGGPFVRDKQLGTRLHLQLDARGRYL
ncbi:uncharacterized transmembrane protein DDB_G0289901-like [Corapipo altera]|uniref:uncharacterized transmembrane protein DDB_G0289901-like n=1 Tax=Corapipo altera TaxID=415028 RepID=UPI000FD68821|nr:uncharacterized transmembrane protein DDB_G0289901-like [Corapipo altera]